MVNIKRMYYHEYDFYQCVVLVDQNLKIMVKKNLAEAIRMTRCQFPHIGISTMREKYNSWVTCGRPATWIHNDQRTHKINLRAITDHGELEVVKQILEMNYSQHQVTYQTVRNLTIEQWHKENLSVQKEYQFVACDGWIHNFTKRHDLSSQLVSRHSTTTAKQIDDPVKKKSIHDYLIKHDQFVIEQGFENVYNFDETSFVNDHGLRTIASKRTVSKHIHKDKIVTTHVKQRSDQPKIKNYVNSNQRVSIGCLITEKGEKLPPIINVKGTSPRCIHKFGSQALNNPKVCYTKTSWFHEETMFKVLDTIHEHSHGKRSLCIWDSYKPHQQKTIIDYAKKLNIEILFVPSGLTGRYQPLDYNFNGIFKNIMKSYWFGHQYNQDKENICQHMYETIMESYKNVSVSSVISSFDCLKNKEIIYNKNTKN